MIQHQGIFFPDDELHMLGWMDKSGEIVDGRGTYQIKKLRAALSHVKKFRTAIDIGGHVGLWSMQLLKKFEEVHAFEPVLRHRECFDGNIAALRQDSELGKAPKLGNVWLHPYALGEKDGRVSIESEPNSSGGSRISGEGDIPMHRLDAVAVTNHFQNVDFIKLDCEGYELFSLKGGEALIKEYLPVIIVEQKPGRAQRFGLNERGALDYLMGLGYECVEKLSGDFVMVAN